MAHNALEQEPKAAAAAPLAASDDARVAAPYADAPALDDGRARKGQQRSCIVTRVAQAPEGLIRFVLSPQGVVTPDIRRVLPGRGVWVTASRAVIAEAVKRKAFARAFRKDVTVPQDLADMVGGLLSKDALQALSLGNKAGAVVAGFEKVREALGAAKVTALIEASDGSADGRRKLVGAAQAQGDAVPVLDSFASGELDLALGRSHVIHAALLKAPAGGFALMKCLRFHRFEKHASGGAESRGGARETSL